MTVFSRRILPLIAIVAVTATLSAWVTAGAAPLRPTRSAVTVLKFQAVPVSTHFSTGGASKTNPAGASLQFFGKLVSDGHQIGHIYLLDTVVTRSAWGLAQISAYFPGKGRVELQGAWKFGGDKAGNTAVITGGTGIFAGATGILHGYAHGKAITLTFS